MRILICTSELPLPPFTGTRLALVEVLKRLATDHELTVVGYRWPGQAPAALGPRIDLHSIQAPQIGRVERGMRWASGLHAAPVQTIGLFAPMSDVVTNLLSKQHYDVAHVTAMAIAHLGPALGNVPKVMVSVDAWNLNARSRTAESTWLMKPIRRLEERRIERFERETFRTYDCVVTVTEEDAQELRRLGANPHIAVIPNGVDTTVFHPDPSAREQDLLVFVGSMRWAPNIRAARFLCRDILPRVRAHRPSIRVAIVGRGPAEQTRDELESCPGVVVTGEVDDVVPWLQRAAVVVSPMIDGTGIKNKVLEGLACGAPSVATALACQGMTVTHGKEILLGESAEELAQAISSVLGDAQLRQRLSEAGRGYVEQFHQWDAVVRRYEDVYRDVAGLGRSPHAANAAGP